MNQLQINAILYCNRGNYGAIDKYTVVKVTPTTATIKSLENRRTEIKINRDPSNTWNGLVAFYGKGDYKNNCWYLENEAWIEKYERQTILSFLTHELRAKSDWQKLPMDKLKELKKLIE